MKSFCRTCTNFFLSCPSFFLVSIGSSSLVTFLHFGVELRKRIAVPGLSNRQANVDYSPHGWYMDQALVLVPNAKGGRDFRWEEKVFQVYE